MKLRTPHTLITAPLLLCTALFVSGCPDGGAENAGENLDDAAEDVGDSLEDAADSVEDAFDQ